MNHTSNPTSSQNARSLENSSKCDRPLIIAELSGNHQQDINTAKQLIDAAAAAGVDAIKLQTYTADSMTLATNSEAFTVNESGSLWRGESLHDLYTKAATPYDWHRELFDYAHTKELMAFSSPFDKEAVDFLDELEVPCFKIASFEITDIPLIRHAASKGKPLIMSTGMATIEEIQVAIETAKEAGCDDITLLKCTSTYPSSPENSHLNTIPDMQARFGLAVGLSDHSRGIGVAVAAVALGVTMIEKHLVLDRNSDAVDAQFSMTPEEFKLLVTEVRRASQAMGSITYGGTEAEQASKKYRRSIYASCDIQKGETLSEANLQIIRPAFGLPPVDWDKVQGMKATRDIAFGTPLDWSLVSE